MNVYKNNLKRIFNSIPKIIIIFLVPILFTLLFMSDENEITVEIDIVDNDQSLLSQNLINTLKEENIVKLIEPKELRDDVIVGAADYAIVIPKGFETAIIGEQDVLIEELYFIESMKLYGVRSYIESYLNQLRFIASITNNSDEFYYELENLEEDYFVINKEKVENKTTELSESAIGFMIQFILYMSIISAALLIVDRDRNTVIRIMSSSTSKARYITESFLSFITVGVLQITIMFGFYEMYFHLDFGPYFWLVYLLMLMFMVVATSLAMMIVVLVKNEKFSYGLVLVLTTPLVMLGGCYFAIDAMPEVIGVIAKFLPTYWTMEGAKTLIHNQVSGDILMNFAILLTFSITFLIISMIGYKKFQRE